MNKRSTDVLVVGAGLAGLVTAYEAALRGKSVTIIDQENRASLGGQAFWSLGGLFMVNSKYQRRLGVKDSVELAWNDWQGSAQFDRDEDANPRKVAKQFVEFAAGEMHDYLTKLGLKFFPIVGWAERGGDSASRHGNSVPRFHLPWGIGPAVVKTFLEPLLEFETQGKVTVLNRYRAVSIDQSGGKVTGIRGDILADDEADRGRSTSRDVVGQFQIEAEATVLTTGGIGGNHDIVRKYWPEDRLGKAPQNMIAGVPDYVDGNMHMIAESAGAGLINMDRMWHYFEGIRNWDPIWPKHGIRILPGPSSMLFDGNGKRLEAPYLPGYDSLGTIKRVLSAGHEHSWFITTQKILEKEFALSGSEQNPDLAGGTWGGVLKSRFAGKGAHPNVELFKENGDDFVVSDNLEDLVEKMNAVAPSGTLDASHIRAQIEARDLQMDNKFSKDAQVIAIHTMRNYLGDKLLRTAKPHKILDPSKGPLIGVRLNMLTRKSLGGIHTDSNGQVIRPDGEVFAGLFAAGEAAGFGGGGYHGYNALEGTFLGGCIFSGRNTGRAV